MDKFFKVFDIYGSNFNLRINGQSKFKSVVGGFLSLVTIAILVWTVINFGKDFYMRDNPRITIEDGIYSDMYIPILNGTDYEERIVIIQYEIVFDKIIKPITNIIVQDNIKEVYLPECNLDYLKNRSIVIDENDYLYQQYSFYCLRLNDFSIGGMSNSRDAAIENLPLIIQWKDCADIDDETISQNNLTKCDRSYNETNTLMQMTIWNDKLGFDPNSKNPFVKKITSQLYIFTIDKNTFVYYPLSIYNLNDDVGWMAKDVVTLMDFNFIPSNTLYYPQVNSAVNYPKSYIIINVSDDFKVFTRTYIKLQDLLATIGGFMKLVFSILNIFNVLIRIYLIDYYLVNRIFDNEFSSNFKVSVNRNSAFVDSPISSNRSIFLNKIYLESKKTSTFININMTARSDVTKNSKIKILDNDIDKEKDKDGEDINAASCKSPPEARNSLNKKYIRPPYIDFSSYFSAVIYNMMNRSFDINTKRGKNLEEIRKKILVSDKVRDFNYILDKITEVDLMKTIILNEHQGLCLEYIQKPREIDLTDAPQRFSKLINTDLVNKNTIQEYFSKLLNEDILMGHDEFLFRKLDDSIKENIMINLAKNIAENY